MPWDYPFHREEKQDMVRMFTCVFSQGFQMAARNKVVFIHMFNCFLSGRGMKIARITKCYKDQVARMLFFAWLQKGNFSCIIEKM